MLISPGRDHYANRPIAVVSVHIMNGKDSAPASGPALQLELIRREEEAVCSGAAPA